MALESVVSSAPAPKPPRGGRAWPLVLALLIGFALPVITCLALMVTAALSLQILASGVGAPAPLSGSGGSGPAVAVIRVSGVLVSGRTGAFETGSAGSDNLIDEIKQAKEDASVKAILLMVNSPGGSVIASDLIYQALKNAGKPIVVMMGDTAASGGYYISMASQWIVANPNSLTGSIGVISEFPNASGLLQKVGVDFVVITSGPRKDIGSPYREMTDAERAYWQAIIDETYQGFVAIVAEGRHKTVDEIKPLADGGVYTGRQALKLGLVDQLGYDDDALAKAAELGGISGKPRIVEYKRSPTMLDLLNNLSQSRSLVPSLAEVMNLIGHPTLSAQWIGQ
jgi:protease IV